MDPNHAWAQIQSELGNGSRETIAELADGLIGWLSRDGAMPNVQKPFDGFSRPELLAHLRVVRSLAEMA